MDPWEQILYNIVGGALVAVLTWLFLKLVKKYYKWNFKRVFGKDSASAFYIVYGQMKLKPSLVENGKPVRYPYHKATTGGIFAASSIVAFPEAKGTKYLSETFGEVINIAPKLISDDELRDKLDVSFCSIGGHNNLKTIDVLHSDENTFFDFDLTPPGSIVSKEDRKTRFPIRDGYDMAFIIKITPKNFPKRVWIAVAGLGEWGTSGAAWFLSRNWKKMPKTKSFGIVVKVRAGQDESAQAVHQVTRQ